MNNNDISSAVNEYLNQKEPSDERFALRTSLGATMGSQPDYEAEMQSLSAQTGVPIETAKALPEDIKTQAKINQVNYDELTTDFPLTSKFLSDPQNASVSHDDIGAMKILENGWKAFRSGIQKGSIQEELGELNFTDLLGISSPEQTARREKLKADMALIDEGMKDDSGLSYFTGQTGYAGRQLVTSLKGGGKGAILGAGTGITAAVIAGQLGPQVLTPEEVLTVPGAAITGAKVGFKGGALIQGFKMEAGFAWDEFKDLKTDTGQPLDPMVAKGAAYAVGAVNSALEFIALDKLIKIIPQADKILSVGGKNAVKALLKTETGRQALANFGKRWFGAVTTEAITEGLQELSVIIGGELAKVGSGDELTMPTEEGIKAAAGRTIEAGLQAATGAAGLGLAGGAGSRVVTTVKDRINAKKVEQTETLIRALGDAGNESKLAKRLPERYQELIRTIRGENGPVENVFIPAEQFNAYFQSKGVDPSLVAEEVGATNHKEATAAGTDVMIPVEKYAATIARTEHHNGLAEDIKFNQSDMTVREYTEQMNDRKEQEKKLQDLANQELKTDEQIKIAESIKTQFAQNLIDVGTDRATAEAYAASYARAIVNLAERAGLDPMVLAERYGLSVSRPMPGVLTQDTRSDITLDPLLDALRAGKIPTEREVYGMNLIDFIKSKGGINPELGGRGELLSMDEGRKGFARITNKQSQYSLDRMAEAAVESGYLIPGKDFEQNTPTEAEMLDAISRGESIYSSENVDYNLEDYRNQLEKMRSYLSSLGIDLSVITDNPTVRKMMEAALENIQKSSPDIFDLFQFAGRKSEMAPVEKLPRAVQMINSGSSMEDVRKETGWFMGQDQRWRYEISDENAKIKEGVKFGGAKKYTLDQILDHKELFKAYPELKNIKVELRVSRGRKAGTYDRSNKTITIYVNKAMKPEFQELEKEFQKILETPEFKELNKKWQAAPKDEREGIYSEFIKTEIGNRYHELRPFLQAAKYNLVVPKTLPESNLSVILHEIQHAIQHIEGFATGASSGKSASSYQKYLDSHGEVEARDVEARKRMTSEQRAITPPAITTYKTPIVRWDTVVKELPIEEMPDPVLQQIKIGEQMTLFQRLLIQHNLTEGNLQFANRMGGLAAPSLAVTSVESPLTSFGNITLIGPKSMADPRSGTRVFGADIYSPRYPDVVYKFRASALKALDKHFEKELKATNSYIDQNDLERSGPGYFENKPWAMMKFLELEGVESDLRYNVPDEATIKAIEKYGLDKYYGIQSYNLTDDEQFQKDAVDAQIAQYKESFDEADFKEFLKAINDPEDLGYRRRIIREWARNVELAGQAQTNPDFDYAGTRDALRDQIKSLGKEQAFQDYLSSIVEQQGPQEKIEKVSDSGTRRYIEHTIENVVAILKRELRGGEDFNYGVGSIRSRYAPEFKSVSAIKAAEGRLVSKVAFDSIKNEINDEFFALGERLKRFHSAPDSFRYYDAVSMMMTDAAKMGIPRALIENQFKGVDRNGIEEIASFLDKLKDLPTEYFEAKILRGVDLGEFVAAVVPDTASDQTKQMLQSKGLKVFEYSGEEGQSAAVTRAAESMGSQVLFQSASIRSGRETLKKYGLNPDERYTTREVASALEARQRAKYGSISKDDRSKEAMKKIAKWMVAEVEFEMLNPEKSGVGWYSEKFQRALDTMSEVYPELKTDKTSRNMMTALIAITSDGQKVVPNFMQAMEIYGVFKNTGKFDTARGSNRQASVAGNLAIMQRLFDEYGADGMHKFLMQEKTVSDLKKIAKERGLDLNVEYQAHIKMPMAAIAFGPKLGAFYANLMGSHGYLTMDRWWSRTFNRYRGTLIDFPTQAGLDRFKKLIKKPKISNDQAIAETVKYRDSYESKGFKNGTEIEKAANTIYKDAFENLIDAPFNSTDRTFMLDAVNEAQKMLQKKGVDISVADIQAVLWYYEKRLYGELGARQTADISYEEAARRVVNSIGRPSAAVPGGLQEGAGAEGISLVRPGQDEFGVSLYQGGEDNRGFIQIGKDRKMNIALLEKADLSTVLHELGHFYLEVLQDLASAQDAPAQIQADFRTILEWFGVTPEQWATFNLEQRREYHEKFARGHEAYLMEGKAPSEELRSIFAKFKDWLKLIYKQLVNLNVELTDEVRSVFDRIYASDAEIEAAKRSVPTEPMFATAKDAGLSELEFEQYNKALGKQAETAREALLEKLMAEKAREQKEWWKKARAEMMAQVTAEVDAMPVYRAFAALSAGKLEDGTPIKLNSQALKNKYGDEYAKRIPVRLKSKAEGMDADAAAAYLGYESGDKLIEDLVGMKPRKEYIQAEVQDRMVRTYGDMMLDGSISDEAKTALHNQAREQVLMTELRLIAKKKREVQPFVRAAMQDYKGRAKAALDVPPIEFFRETAKAVMDKTMVKDIVPYSFLRAQQKASKQAISAMAKGDFETAQKAKERELLNHHLYLEAVKAKEDADKIFDYAKKFETRATRERIGKAGGDYLQQIDAILDRYEFRRIPLSKLQKRRALLDWVNEQEAQGEEPAIDERILDEARQVNYREVPISELRAVRDAVKNIEHIARFKNKLIANNKRVEFQDAVSELIASAEQNGKGIPRPIDPNLTSPGKEFADRVRSIDAALLKMEQLIRWLDGGNVDGPWHTYLWNPIAEAQFKEYDLQKQIGKKITESFEKMPKEMRVSMLDTYDVPGIGKVTKKFIMSIAFNMGNQENIDKMMKGHGWSMTVIEGALSNLTAEDWQFVQETWDTISSLWPQIAELEKRMTGLEPTKVVPQPYTARGKPTPGAMYGDVIAELRGGYFPLKYDPNYSEQGAKQEAGNLGQMFEQGYVRATTSKGHTKARTQFAAPLVMDFEQVITGHLTQVIKDLTHREAIVSANKIITNREIRGALQAALGVEYEKQFMPWLRSVVNDRNTSSVQGAGAATKLMMQVRANVIAATMGYSATTVLTQFVGFSASLDMVKAKYLGQAMIDFLKHPVKVRNEINELSGEIRNLEQSRDRDIRAVFKNFTTDQTAIGKVQEMAFHGIAMADAMVKVPTWLGAYRQAIAEGKDKETAIREGDAAVRMTQGSGAAKDLSAIQRNNEFWKTMTMFYSYFNVLYNRMRDMGHEVQEIRDMPKFLARAMFTVMIPAVMGDLIVGRGPDDDEDEALWVIRKMLLYPTLSIPVIRDIASSIDSGYDYRFSPIATGFEKIGGLAKSTGKLYEGDMEWGDYCIKATDTIGFVVGVPGTTQATRTAKYLWRVEQGEENPDNIMELIGHAAVGKKPEK